MSLSRQLSLTGGGKPFEVTQQMRKDVTYAKLAGTPHERIAQRMCLTLDELHYYFYMELEFALDDLVRNSVERQVILAHQSDHLPTSHAANRFILETQSKQWRAPKDRPAEIAQEADDLSSVPASRLTLEEAKREFARLDKRRTEAMGRSEADYSDRGESGEA